MRKKIGYIKDLYGDSNIFVDYDRKNVGFYVTDIFCRLSTDGEWVSPVDVGIRGYKIQYCATEKEAIDFANKHLELFQDPDNTLPTLEEVTDETDV